MNSWATHTTRTQNKNLLNHIRQCMLSSAERSDKVKHKTSACVQTLTYCSGETVPANLSRSVKCIYHFSGSKFVQLIQIRTYKCNFIWLIQGRKKYASPISFHLQMNALPNPDSLWAYRQQPEERPTCLVSSRWRQRSLNLSCYKSSQIWKQTVKATLKTWALYIWTFS